MRWLTSLLHRQVAEQLQDVVDFDDVDFFMGVHHEGNSEPGADSEIQTYMNFETGSSNEQSRLSEEARINQFKPFQSSKISMSLSNPVHPIRNDTRPSRTNESLPVDRRQSVEEEDKNDGGPLAGSENSASQPTWSIISRGEFSLGLNMLSKHKKWVERAARRSSIGFHRDRPASDKEAMDRFLVALAGGTHLRRHQSGCVAEMVRLFSTTGCRTIQWERPSARSLLAQRKREGGELSEGTTDAIFVQKHDRSPFDCCVASK